MKHLVIIGGGGMGRSVFCIAQKCIGYGKDYDIVGFIDDNIHSMDGFEGYPPIIGTIGNYSAKEDEVFICSIGNVSTKKRICQELEKKKFNFISLISKDAIVRQNAKIGKGSIIAEYASVGADAVIGNHCLVQTFSIVAHDCILEDFVRIDTHSVCVGGTVIKNCATIHTGAVLNHKVVIGENATVAACSFVVRKVKPNTTVMGNPAKLL